MQPNPREGNFREPVDSLEIPAGRSRTPTSLVPGSGSTAAEPCGECEANEEGRCLLGSMQLGSQMVARSMSVSEGSVWTCEIKPGIRLVPRSNDSSLSAVRNVVLRTADPISGRRCTSEESPSVISSYTNQKLRQVELWRSESNLEQNPVPMPDVPRRCRWSFHSGYISSTLIVRCPSHRHRRGWHVLLGPQSARTSRPCPSRSPNLLTTLQSNLSNPRTRTPGAPTPPS
jgi:hypothetical protein